MGSGVGEEPHLKRGVGAVGGLATTDRQHLNLLNGLNEDISNNPSASPPATIKDPQINTNNVSPALQARWITEGHYEQPHLLRTMARGAVPTGVMALRSPRSVHPLKRPTPGAGGRGLSEPMAPLSGWGHKRSGRQGGREAASH